MPISDETREHIADIDDPVVKTELIHLMSTVDAINAGTGGDERSEEFCRAFDRSVEGFQGAIRSQHASISRLLDERRQLLKTAANLQAQLSAANQWSGHRARGKSEGPE